MKGLLDTAELDRRRIVELLESADEMRAMRTAGHQKSEVLKGRVVATLFFEDSTRTRLSFETAARRLSAEVLSFSATTSSVNKGESLRDTVETLQAIGADGWVVRHKSSGVPAAIARWSNVPVVNAGDGWHQHPTQALLDAFTITREFGTPDSLEGVRVAIVGDVRHSRVARSNVDVLSKLGAEVVLVGPRTLLPVEGGGWGARTTDDLDGVLEDTDVLYLLRVQRERMTAPRLPDRSEYCERFALTPERAKRLKSGSLLLHPGPMNRGTEVQVDPSVITQSRILDQVSNGVAVRMAVLADVLGAPERNIGSAAGGSAA